MIQQESRLNVADNSGALTTASVNVLHVARGESFFDDVRLVELTLADDFSERAIMRLATGGG